MVHQFKTLMSRGLLAVRTLDVQSAFGKLRSVWPQRIVRKADGPCLYFAVTKILVAIPTRRVVLA